MANNKNNIDTVKQFMLAFNQEVPAPLAYKDTVPPIAIRRLRAKLILEEALEAVKALGFGTCISFPEYSQEQDDKLVYAGNVQAEFQIKDIILEELYEYNFIECLDALVDLDYVASSGTSVALGISSELYDKAFALIHTNNMSKTLDKDKDGKILKGPLYVPVDLGSLLV